MLQAMNTGHDGSLSTGHANSCADMLSRLEMMVCMGMDLPISAIRSQIASAIDILVHLGRLRDGSRHVLSIAEVRGMTAGEVEIKELFGYREEAFDTRGKGKLIRIEDLQDKEKLLRAGMLQKEKPLEVG